MKCAVVDFYLDVSAAGIACLGAYFFAAILAVVVHLFLLLINNPTKSQQLPQAGQRLRCRSIRQREIQ